MNRRNLGLSLIVGLAALVVAAGTVTAHGAVGPGLGMTPDAAQAAGDWWSGTHMGPGPDVMGGPMGPYADGTGFGAGEAGFACAGPWNTGMMGGTGGWGMGSTGLWGLGALWPMLLLALVVAAGYVLLTDRRDEGADRAMELLRERYATGELSEEEFASRREALRT